MTAAMRGDSLLCFRCNVRIREALTERTGDDRWDEIFPSSDLLKATCTLCIAIGASTASLIARQAKFDTTTGTSIVGAGNRVKLQSLGAHLKWLEDYGKTHALYPFGVQGIRVSVMVINKTTGLEDGSWSGAGDIAIWPKEEDGVRVKIVQPDGIDYGSFKRLIQVCKKDHASCEYGRGRQPEQLRLIDCTARILVSDTSAPYVALSYVWGTKEEFDHTRGLKHKLPQTIEDAITVTIELGYRYLWVDRYCINQADDDEVKFQVSQMNLIYQRSALTIVAIGDDPSSGLAGVSRSGDRTMRQTHSTQYVFQEIQDDLDNVIFGSRWKQRGWTFQEGMFSRRRLIITELEAYLECKTCGTRESSPKSNYKHFILPRIHQSHLISPLTFTEYLREYTQRRLSHSSDIMNACAGVLKAFEESPSFRHCWGLPVLATPFVHDAPKGAWTAAMSFLTGLAWSLTGDHSVNTKYWRHDGFPSWSWCGWTGELASTLMCRWDDMWPWGISWAVSKSVFHEDIAVQLELLDGTCIDWGIYAEHKTLALESQLSVFIHITAMTTQVRLLPSDDSPGSTVVSSAGGVKWSFVAPLQFKGKSLPDSGFIIHVLPAYRYPWPGLKERRRDFRETWSSGPFLLIVSGTESGDGRFERVGAFQQFFDGYEYMSKSIRTLRLG